MPLFSLFRVRSPERDAETDRGRFQKLAKALEETVSQIETERRGLARRHEEATEEAGFAQAVYEDGRAGESTSRRIDDLTQDIVRCHARLAELERQAAFLRRITTEVETFARIRGQDQSASSR